MGLLSKRRKTPTDAAGIIDECMSLAMGLHPNGLTPEMDSGVFNWAFTASLVCLVMEGERDTVDVVTSDDNPVLNSLNGAGIMALVKAVSMCVAIAEENRVTIQDFRSLTNPH